MQSVPRVIVDKFGQAFAGRNVGFSAKQITDYFTGYSALVKPYDHYAMNPTRLQLFVESVYALPPEQQYYALNDLAFLEHESRYNYPSEDRRTELRHELHTFISPNPIGMAFSTLRDTAFRKDWVTAYGRLQANPAGAVTAARTLLETVLKTIITERADIPDNSGQLTRLLRQAEEAVGFMRAEQQAEHQVLQGLVTTIEGVSSISNAAGDRHGTVAGVKLNDNYLATLCVNACGAVALSFIAKHLFHGVEAEAERA